MTFVDGENPFGDPIPLFLFQILFITVLSRVLGKVLRFVKQPLVIAEMLSGIILGPSVLGRIPKFSDTFFPPSNLPVFQAVANLGLVIFMFLVGLEMDQKLLRSKWVHFSATGLIGITVPFIASVPISWLLYVSGDSWVVPDKPFYLFAMFVGVGVGFSSLPVLGRILAEKGLLQKEIGVLSMATSAVEDLGGWIILAVVIAISRSSNQLQILYTALLAIANLIVLLFIVRPCFNRLSKRVNRTHTFTTEMFFVVLVILLIFSWLVEQMGLSAIFGAFEVGCVMPRNEKMIPSINTRLQDITVIIFMPLYFTYSGLRTNVGLIEDGISWAMCLLLSLVAFLSKVGGEAGAAKYIGKLSWKDSFVFGVLLQTKGLVALVVFNLGLDLGVITPKFFSVGVVMVLILTAITSPLVALIYRKKGIDVTDSDVISFLLCASDSHSAELMVSIVQPMVESRETGTTVINALNVIEGVGPEGTGIMTTWLYQKKNYFKSALKAARNRAKMLGVKLDTSSIISEEAGREIVDAAGKQKANLVLVSTKSHIHHYTHLSTVGFVLEHARESDIGVLLTQDNTMELISSVLVLVPGGDAESRAVRYASLLSKGKDISITLLHVIKPNRTDHQETNSIMALCADNTSTKYVSVESNDPIESLATQLAQQEFTLLILDDIHTKGARKLYQEATCNVLVLHKSGTTPTENSSSSDDEAKASGDTQYVFSV